MRNLITIGFEAHLSVTQETPFDSDFWPGGVERIFLALYCIEAGIRLLAGGWSAFKDCWFLHLDRERTIEKYRKHMKTNIKRHLFLVLGLMLG